MLQMVVAENKDGDGMEMKSRRRKKNISCFFYGRRVFIQTDKGTTLFMMGYDPTHIQYPSLCTIPTSLWVAEFSPLGI